MWSRRMERINELLLREISSFVTGRHDPEVGFITFTGVEVTEDLMDAKVFYSVLGSEDERARAAGRLEQLNPEIWRSLRHLESLRRIPQLHFHFDDTPARAARVAEIIETLHKRVEEPAPDPTNKKTNGRRPSSKKAR